MSEPRGKGIPTYMYDSVVRDLGDPTLPDVDLDLASRNYGSRRAEMRAIVSRPFDSFARAEVVELRRRPSPQRKAGRRTG